MSSEEVVRAALTRPVTGPEKQGAAGSSSSKATPLHKPTATLRGHKGAVNAVVFNSDGTYCMTGGDDRRLLLWNPHREDEAGNGDRKFIKEYAMHNQRVLDVTIAKDNASFASCGGDKSVFVWDVTSGRVLRRLLGHEQRVNAVRYNADCSVLVSGSYDRTVRCWDLRSKNKDPIQQLDNARDSVSSLQVVAHEIFVGSIDGSVRIFDLRKGKLAIDIINTPVTHLAVSSDQNCVLAACLDSTLRLLDKATGELLVSYSGHENTSYKLGCCFSRDDANVMCGSEDGAVHVWDLVEGKPLAQLRCHTGAVGAMCCHPKDSALLTASYDGTAKLWSMKGSG